MHNLGQSNMETNMHEYAQEYGGAMHEGPYETGYAGESPLQEILGHEAPMYEEEALGYEAAFQETAMEGPYQETYEAPYHEAAYQEGAFHEAPYQEAATFESDEGPLGEIIQSETGQFGESQEGSWNEVLNEDEELALASELVDVQSEEEMDRFLGKLVRRVSRGVRGFVRTPMGQMLAGVLRRAAKVALPKVGMLGAFVGGPAGAMLGGQLANMAGKSMGLELNEMAPQEADFTAARQFVRFAADMMRRAQGGQPGAAASAVIRQAVQGAAQRFAPGLLSRQLPPLRVGPSASGRRGVWVRRGRTITLYGA